MYLPTSREAPEGLVLDDTRLSNERDQGERKNSGRTDQLVYNYSSTSHRNPLEVDRYKICSILINF